jgi:hypothetical protein
MAFPKDARAVPQVIGNGSIMLSLRGGKFLRVYGGPYPKKPSRMRGVKMAQEINLPCDVSVPTADFGVPSREDLLKGLNAVLGFLRDRDEVYVGCMGGIGRTGTFLALLLKLWGSERPVAHLRSIYLNHAVETRKQEELVEAFTFPFTMRVKVAWLKARGLLPGPSLMNDRDD